MVLALSDGLIANVFFDICGEFRRLDNITPKRICFGLLSKSCVLFLVVLCIGHLWHAVLPVEFFYQE